MENSQVSISPLSVAFKSDGFILSLSGKEALKDWCSQEYSKWNTLINVTNDEMTHHLERNRNILDKIRTAEISSMDNKDISSIEESYLPFDGYYGRYLESCGVTDQVSKRYCFSFYMRPAQPNAGMNQSVIEARVISSAFRAILGGVAFQGELREEIRGLSNLYKDENNRITKFNELIAQIDGEWRERIRGYAAAIALSAPRDYWEKRHGRHKSSAEEARKSWGKSVRTVSLGLFFVAALFLFGGWEWLAEIVRHWAGVEASSKPLEPPALLADMLRRTIAFGTVAGVGIWWLRQKLRDMRSHEHLAEDADERVTMIQTFAAMQGAGLVGADLGPIFTALYRNATTGLVTDDGGGPMVPIEIVGKLFDAGKAK